MRAKLSFIGILIVVLLQALPCGSQEPVKLRASVVAKTFGFGPLWVASKQGFFAQQKLDVEILLIRGSDVSTQALAGGSLQVSGAASDAPIDAIERGLDMVIVGGIINGLSQSVMGGQELQDLRRPAGGHTRSQQSDFGNGLCVPARTEGQRIRIPAGLQIDQRRWL